MPTCTFFGHRDVPFDITPALVHAAVSGLIVQRSVSVFYVGNEGRFDRIVQTALAGLQKEHPHICSYIVQAYHPSGKKPEYPPPLNTIFPENLAAVIPRFAITARNRWMLKRSDYVVTCIRHTWGGAAKFAALAQAHGKHIIAL